MHGLSYSHDFWFILFHAQCRSWETGVNKHCNAYKNKFWTRFRGLMKVGRVLFYVLLLFCVSASDPRYRSSPDNTSPDDTHNRIAGDI